MKKLILPLLALLFMFGCNMEENPVNEGEAGRETTLSPLTDIKYYTAARFRYEVSGTSRIVYMHYYANNKNYSVRTQTLPFNKEYIGFKKKYYYLNITNLEDSGFVKADVYVDDSLIVSKSMAGKDGNIRIEGYLK